MKLSELKFGDRFYLETMPSTLFTLVNPRFGLFTTLGLEKCKWVYISDSNQLYASPHDYKVVPANMRDDKDSFPLLRQF